MIQNAQSRNNLFTLLIFVSILLTLMTIVLSAYIRLSTNGLGCEPWPQCYGYVGALDQYTAKSSFTNAQPQQPHGFARMLHRVVASALGLFIIMIVAMAMRMRKRGGPGIGLPFAILGITVFLSVLGYTTPSPWIPAVTVGNLVGGMAMLAMLWWLGQTYTSPPIQALASAQRLGPLATIALGGLFAQILLGAWVSGNFAGPACPGPGLCSGDWLQALNPLRVLATQNGMIVPDEAMPAIHFLHRSGAVLLLLYLAWFGWQAKASEPRIKPVVNFMFILLILQMLVGIGQLVLDLPLALVTSHNALAALLLMTLVNIRLNLSLPKY
ncbi:MAG: COX15/CtaA family protein [Gammaproteobacteria bacterium]|nr:COX15/CtaA family protein [Gammaproteobacteria bacterium]